MTIQTVDQIEVKGKRVFIRVDLNAPLNEKNEITDDTRIVQSLPTIRSIIERGGRSILASHLGRPKGKRDPKYSLAPVVERLSRLLGRNVVLRKRLHRGKGAKTDRRNESRRGASSGESEVSSGRGEK